MNDVAGRIGDLSPGQRSVLLSRLADLRANRAAGQRKTGGPTGPVSTADPAGPVGRVSPAGPVPLLPAQRLLLERLEASGTDPGTYNITSLVQAPGRLRADLAELALAHVVTRHDALRLRFSRTGSGWCQEAVEIAEPMPLRFVELTSPSEDGRAGELRRVARELHDSLDVAAGPVLRLALVQPQPGEASLLLLVISHLVADGYSAGLLIGDLWTAYRQLERGEAIRLPDPTTSFKQWAQRLEAYAAAPEFEDDTRYWRDFPWERVTVLPAGSPGPGSQGTLTSIEATLPANETAALLNCLPPGTQLPEALLAGLVTALGRWAGGHVLAVSLVRHGRAPVFDDIDLSRTAGWLTVHPTVLIDLAGVTGLAAGACAVADQLHRVPREGIAWEWMRYSMPPEERSQWASRLRQGHLTFDYQSGGHALPSGLRPVTDKSGGEFFGPHIWAGRSLFVGAQVIGGALRVKFGFDELAYPPDTVASVADDLMAALRAPG